MNDCSRNSRLTRCCKCVDDVLRLLADLFLITNYYYYSCFLLSFTLIFCLIKCLHKLLSLDHLSHAKKSFDVHENENFVDHFARKTKHVNRRTFAELCMNGSSLQTRQRNEQEQKKRGFWLLHFFAIGISLFGMNR